MIETLGPEAIKFIDREIAKARAEERERCARVADAKAEELIDQADAFCSEDFEDAISTATEIAAAIRGLKDD